MKNGKEIYRYSQNDKTSIQVDSFTYAKMNYCAIFYFTLQHGIEMTVANSQNTMPKSELQPFPSHIESILHIANWLLQGLKSSKTFIRIKT